MLSKEINPKQNMLKGNNKHWLTGEVNSLSYTIMRMLFLFVNSFK